jgi:hypothetical protein
MKLLKNFGWFLLAVLSFFFGYGFIQGSVTISLSTNWMSLFSASTRSIPNSTWRPMLILIA